MSRLESANIFVTGGAGTLGRAIARRRAKDGWTGRLTVYSGDNHKHEFMRRQYPDVQYVQGDIRNPETLYNAMAGHDVVIHAAAVKVIPTSEHWSLDTVDVNVNGSQIVCEAALRANVGHVLGISTDKACHPANAYGATKMLMEKIFQEYSRSWPFTKFHLVRYGNVLESTGSVIEAWKKSVWDDQPIKITDPAMTRFWLSPAQAVDYVIESLEFESGQIYVPMMPALSIGKLADWTVGAGEGGAEIKIQRIPMRPGEKIHETLVTRDEIPHAFIFNEYYLIEPSTSENVPYIPVRGAYSSDVAQELTKEQLATLLLDE